MKNMLISLLCRLLGIGKALFYIFIEGVKNEVLKSINERELQKLATQAVIGAYKAGFKGDDAWDKARVEFVSWFYVKKQNLADNLIDTILQTAYTRWKYSGKPLTIED